MPPVIVNCINKTIHFVLDSALQTINNESKLLSAEKLSHIFWLFCVYANDYESHIFIIEENVFSVPSKYTTKHAYILQFLIGHIT